MNLGGENMRKVYGLIRRLGATSKYKGVLYTGRSSKNDNGSAGRPGRAHENNEGYLSQSCQKV